MSLWDTLWGKPQQKKNFADVVVECFCEDFVEVTSSLAPDLQEQAINSLKEARVGLKEGVIEFLQDYKKGLTDDTRQATKEQTKQVFNGILNHVLSTTPELNDHPETTQKLAQLVALKQKSLEEGSRFSAQDIKTYQGKLDKAKKLAMLVFNVKKEIRMALIGESQEGKTGLACTISGEKHTRLAKNKKILGSDTIQIKEYDLCRNGVTLRIADMPGTGDSRDDPSKGLNQNQINEKNIEKYFQKHEVDVIIYVAKLGSFPTASRKQAIQDFGRKYGKKLWKKAMVVLTYANSMEPPPHMKEKAFFKLHPELDEDEDEIDLTSPLMPQVELEAWKQFCEVSKATWQTYFTEVMPDLDIPVCLVENDTLFSCPKSEDGIPLLRDNATPFIAEMMCHIFRLVSNDKKPMTLLALDKETKVVGAPMTTHQKSLHAATDQILKETFPGSASAPSKKLPPRPLRMTAAPAATPEPVAPAPKPVSAPAPKPVSAPAPKPVSAPAPKPTESGDGGSWCLVL